MKKISLAFVLMLAGMTRALSQQPDSAETYVSRKLKLSEVNLVSSYYQQEGNNSAVTGGIGTEHLTDFANNIELRFIKNGQNGIRHDFSLEVGIDRYTSASSDQIDPYTISSASSSDTRIYPSLNWIATNDQKHFSMGAGLYYSTEYDYQSLGLGANFAKASADNNREIALRLQAYWDTWHVVLPVELRATNGNEERNEPRNSYSGSLILSQVINKRLQVSLLADVVYQQGLLATKYQRVYFTDLSEKTETLPGTRFKVPIGVRLHYFLADRFIVRTFYRFYSDNWGLSAHTAQLEIPIKLTAFFSVSPVYRFYSQSAARYFAPYASHLPEEAFFTSDYDLSSFISNFLGLNMRWVPAHGVLGISKWSSAELRYGHYMRDTPLTSDIVTLALGFK